MLRQARALPVAGLVFLRLAGRAAWCIGWELYTKVAKTLNQRRRLGGITLRMLTGRNRALTASPNVPVT